MYCQLILLLWLHKEDKKCGAYNMYKEMSNTQKIVIG